MKCEIINLFAKSRALIFISNKKNQSTFLVPCFQDPLLSFLDLRISTDVQAK
jgi:hypothetical protein